MFAAQVRYSIRHPSRAGGELSPSSMSTATSSEALPVRLVGCTEPSPSAASSPLLWRVPPSCSPSLAPPASVSMARPLRLCSLVRLFGFSRRSFAPPPPVTPPPPPPAPPAPPPGRPPPPPRLSPAALSPILPSSTACSSCVDVPWGPSTGPPLLSSTGPLQLTHGGRRPKAKLPRSPLQPAFRAPAASPSGRA